MNIQKELAAALRKRRNALVRQLPQLTSILRGSLIERYKRCGKPGCKCADGPGHGPKYYLSVSYPGQRPQMDYVPQEVYGQTAEVESRTGAVAVACRWLVDAAFALSPQSGLTWLWFLFPLIEPDGRFSRIKCVRTHLMRYVSSKIMWRRACKPHGIKGEIRLDAT